MQEDTLLTKTAHASLPSLGELLFLHPFGAGDKALGSPQPFSISALLKSALLEPPAMGPISQVAVGQSQVWARWWLQEGLSLSQQKLFLIQPL